MVMETMEQEIIFWEYNKNQKIKQNNYDKNQEMDTKPSKKYKGQKWQD